MADTINPQIIITAKDEASQVLRGVGDSAEKTGQSLQDVARGSVVQLGAAFAAVTGVIATSIAAFEEQDRGLKQLDAVLKSTGGAAGMTRQQLIDMSAALQQVTTYSDEQILSGENLLLTFTKIGKEIFPQATTAILDMSTALGQDLKSSAIQLGKALNDPTVGLTALRRVGVSFSDAQVEIIKNLVDTGHQLEAQKMILAEITKEFGGSATAAAKTFGGQMIILKNNVNDLQETIGQGLVTTLASLFGGFDNFSNKIKDLNKFLQQHKDILAAVSIVLITLAVTFGVLLVAALVVLAGTVGIVVLAIGALVAAVAFVATMVIFHWNEIVAKTQEIWNNIVLFLQGVLNAIVLFFQGIFQQISQIVQAALDFIHTVWVDFVTAILLLVDLLTGGMVTRVMSGLILVRQFFEQHRQDIINILTAIWNFIVGIWTTISGWVTSKVNEIRNNVIGAFNAMKSGIEGVVNGIKDVVQGAIDWIHNLISNFHPSISIGINLPDIAGAWRSMQNQAHNLGIPGFAVGGIVPGPIGSPQLALVHGGETVVPNRGGSSQSGGSSGGGVSLNVYVGLYAGSEIEKRNIASELFGALDRVAKSQNKSVSEMIGG